MAYNLVVTSGIVDAGKGGVVEDQVTVSGILADERFYSVVKVARGGGGCPFDETTWSTLNALGDPGGFLWVNGALATDVAVTEYFEFSSTGECNASQQPTSITLNFTCAADDTSLFFSVLDVAQNELGANNGIFATGAHSITVNLTYANPSLHIAYIRVIYFGWVGTITNITYQ